MTEPPAPPRYTVNMSPTAARAFRKLDPPVRRQLMPELLALEDNPRPPGCLKLTGYDNLWRVRSGDYRIVYEIHDGQLLVLVVTVAHRREVYDL